MRARELRWGRERQRLRHELDQQHGGRQRGRGGDRLDDASQEIRRVPHRPEFHQVSCATTQNEGAEHQEHPVKGKITPLANKIDQSQGNAVVGECDQCV